MVSDGVRSETLNKRCADAPELLSEVGAQVLGQLLVVLQAGQQQAAALEQQNGLKWTQEGFLRVRQNLDHLLDLVPHEGQLQSGGGEAFKTCLRGNRPSISFRDVRVEEVRCVGVAV